MKVRIRALAFLVVAASTLAVAAASSSSSSSKPPLIVVRVRRPDGSVERVAVDSLDRPLCDVLQPVCQASVDDDPSSSSRSSSGGAGSNMEVRVGTDGTSSIPIDDRRTLAELSVRHGSLLTLVQKVNNQQSAPASRPHKKKGSSSTFGGSTTRKSRRRWDPFPDLAKDYEAARDQYERKKMRSRTATSYSDLSDMRSQMHTVDPQPDGPLKRVYLCRICAEKFNAGANQHNNPKSALEERNKSSSKKSSMSPSTTATVEAAILFGTIARERVDPKHRPKTSLSSTTEAQEYCHAAHVHAMWTVPPSLLEKLGSNEDDNEATTNVLLPRQVADVATWLGLRVVGWMFAYRGHREEGVPLHANDVVTGARLQIDNMKKKLHEGGAGGGGGGGGGGDEDNQESSRGDGKTTEASFVTLAMDAESGATEAFQLSNVAVQMVAEGILAPAATSENGRTLSSRFPVIVDGQETNEVDSLLCLVNTALLSRVGDYAGPPLATGGKVPSPINKKTGGLTAKVRKALASALRATDNDHEQDLWRLLSDMMLLVALHDLLGPEDCMAICSAVKKWTRQKRGVSMSAKLKERLRRLVEDG